MEFLLELLFEFVIQIIGEALLEIGLRSFAEPFRKPPDAWLAALGYTLFGTIFGLISLWLFPHHMVVSTDWRLVNLFVTPVMAGGCMSLLGAWRAKRGQAVLRIDSFSYGFLFAICFALVRFQWAN